MKTSNIILPLAAIGSAAAIKTLIQIVPDNYRKLLSPDGIEELTIDVTAADGDTDRCVKLSKAFSNFPSGVGSIKVYPFENYKCEVWAGSYCGGPYNGLETELDRQMNETGVNPPILVVVTPNAQYEVTNVNLLGIKSARCSTNGTAAASPLLPPSASTVPLPNGQPASTTGNCSIPHRGRVMRPRPTKLY